MLFVEMRRRKLCCCVFLLTLHLQLNGCLALNPEGVALLAFRSRVAADPYGALENWDPEDSDPCNWTGVHCIDGKVKILDLKDLSLGGTLGPELGKLCHLRAIVLYKNKFFGAIPKEIGNLDMLELLDLRDNDLSGEIPTEIRKMLSRKHLLLCGNKFQGCSSTWIEKPGIHSDLEDDGTFSFAKPNGIGYVKRKLSHWFKFKRFSTPVHAERIGDNLPSLAMSSSFQNIDPVRSLHHRLLEETSNLAALPASIENPPSASIGSIGSGSFPAVPNSSKGSLEKKQPSAPKDPSNGSLPRSPIQPGPSPRDHEISLIKQLTKWPYLVIFPAGAFLLILVLVLVFICRRKEAPTIGPWKTGLSGQLKKAFITGVPKLNRAELLAACEDFSNIISNSSDFTVFKGTLSSGVEIAVVSTTVKSAKDWSKRSESSFRKKIDILSRVNHKNFVNLLGFCEENEPFSRMMVFEYAPNGTLFQHLHVKEFEHLDWAARIRIIMGITYCLRYMHHELNPPVVHLVPQSASIFITDDFAAKVADSSIWKEVIDKGTIQSEESKDPSESQSANPRKGVYNFGILLLEIISGRVPFSDEQGSILNWAMEHLNDIRRIGSLVDPSLKNHKAEELAVVCEVIVDCINEDNTKRPTLMDITLKLRNVIDITPEAATPRLSPLWWAELEILSVQAS